MSYRDVLSYVYSWGSGVLDGVSVLYNNDGENLMTVTSSYHPRGAPINATTIRGTVQDTRGNVDLNMICPELVNER